MAQNRPHSRREDMNDWICDGDVTPILKLPRLGLNTDEHRLP